MSGLGRDEPGGGEGSRGHRLQDGPLHRQLVVGERRRRDPGRRGRQGLQGRDVPRARAPASRCTQEIVKYVYDKGKGAGQEGARSARSLYNRGIVNAMLTVEAIRTAMAKYGNKPPTGEQVRWGFENLNLTDKRLERARHEGLHPPGQGHLRGPRGQRPGADPAVGRQEVERSSPTGWRRCGTSCARRSRRRRSRRARSSGYTMRDCSKEK